jgi:hypothetical protein
MTPVSKIVTITGAAAFLLGAYLSRPVVNVTMAAPAAPIVTAAPAAPLVTSAAALAAPAAAAPVKKAAPVKRKEKPRRPIVHYVVYAAPRCTCGI